MPNRGSYRLNNLNRYKLWKLNAQDVEVMTAITMVCAMNVMIVVINGGMKIALLMIKNRNYNQFSNA